MIIGSRGLLKVFVQGGYLHRGAPLWIFMGIYSILHAVRRNHTFALDNTARFIVPNFYPVYTYHCGKR